MLKTRIREYRTRLRLKQDDLAKLASVRRETIAHLESGKYNPSLKLGMQVAKILNTTVEELFIFSDDEEQGN